jgi:hypothetical protein
MANKSTNTISVFGQIEGVVADAMAAAGKVVMRIPFEDIPPTVAYNKAGERAHCALVLTPDMEHEFDQRVRKLRA